MRPVTITQSGNGSTQMVPMDYLQAPFNVGVGCVVVSGSPNFTVEHTFSDVQDANVSPVWFPNSGITAKTTNTDGNYAFPVRAIRLTINSGNGVVSMTLIQSSR